MIWIIVVLVLPEYMWWHRTSESVHVSTYFGGVHLQFFLNEALVLMWLDVLMQQHVTWTTTCRELGLGTMCYHSSLWLLLLPESNTFKVSLKISFIFYPESISQKIFHILSFSYHFVASWPSSIPCSRRSHCFDARSIERLHWLHALLGQENESQCRTQSWQILRSFDCDTLNSDIQWYCFWWKHWNASTLHSIESSIIVTLLSDW